ncbi:MAG: 3'-5' exonuclease [Proteobacteria bacterium]|nr:3'-5' exonuclease [Pseudomonadota bacterium]
MSGGSDRGAGLLERTIFSFDTETTGLDPIEDRIVQIGGVFLRRGELVGPRRSSLVNPGVPIPPDVTAIHGITDADVADAESFAAVGPRFVEFLLHAPDGEEPILCGYNAPGFDVPFINAELGSDPRKARDSDRGERGGARGSVICPGAPDSITV